MTIYFQHVGEAGGLRDFPKTIGTARTGLKHFQFKDVEQHLQSLSAAQREQISKTLEVDAAEGFQIWGIPSGAKSVLKTLQAGDYLLLLESVGPGGSFAYGGKIVVAVPGEHFALSVALWGEARFPLIVFMTGKLTNHTWFEFCDAFGYKRNWNPAGMTSRITPEKLAASAYTDEEEAIKTIVGSFSESKPASPEKYLLDQVEIEIETEEGRKILRQHLIRERSARLIAEFKSSLKDFRCQVCSFDFEKSYGGLGRHFIEAHHTKSLAGLNDGEKTSLRDLAAVCSNCHRMLHRKYPALTLDDLRANCGEAILKSL